MSRWAGVGTARHGAGLDAGVSAAEQALRDDDAKLLVVFCSEQLDGHDVLAGVAKVAPGVPLIGCSTAGEITSSGPGDSGLVVFALGGDGFSVKTAASDVSQGLRGAGEAVASCVSEVSSEHRVLLMLTDGLCGDQLEIVRGAYSVVGAEVPLVGACAGDDLKMESTTQFHGTDVLSGSVVAAAIGSQLPLGIGVHHGWRRVGEPMLVTASEANKVLMLDGEPALDVYLRKLGAPEAAWSDSATFTQFALTHPLGIQRRSADEVRFVAGADFSERALVCVAHVPQGGLTWVMEGNSESVLEATDAACAEAIDQLGGAAPIGLLAFDCIARRGVLGPQGIDQEVGRIAHHSTGAPVAGFYTYGEIARTSGTGGFHNQTLVVLAVA